MKQQNKTGEILIQSIDFSNERQMQYQTVSVRYGGRCGCNTMEDALQKVSGALGLTYNDTEMLLSTGSILWGKHCKGIILQHQMV